jgi:hypothetical protein
MCAPAALPIAMFAVSAAQAVASYQGQSAQAKAQEQANQRHRQFDGHEREDRPDRVIEKAVTRQC